MLQFFSFVQKYYKLLLVAILVLIIGVQQYRIKCKDQDILELNVQLTQIKSALDTANDSISTLQYALDDESVKGNQINGMLNKCYADMDNQRQEYAEIENIMNATDEVEPVVEESTTVKEVSHEVPISNATNKLGIDFINKQFSAIE